MLSKAEIPDIRHGATATVVIILLAALVLATAGLFTRTASVLLLVLAGLIFGVFLNGLARWVQQHSPLRYPASYALVTGTLLFASLTGLYFLGAQIARRADVLSSELYSGLKQLGQTLGRYSWAEQLIPERADWQSMTVQKASAILPSLFDGLQWATWGMTGAVVVFFVGLYAAYEPSLYRDGLVKLFPPDRRDRANEVLAHLHAALQRWIVSRFFSMVIVGVLTTVGLWVMGVPLPITLGVLAALLTFIPNLGPILAAIPQALLALNVSPRIAIYVIALNFILQGFESYLVTPMIQRHEVTLPPILTISTQLIMGVLFGIIGIMIAAPLVVIAMIVIQLLYIQDVLCDPKPGRLSDQIS